MGPTGDTSEVRKGTGLLLETQRDTEGLDNRCVPFCYPDTLSHSAVVTHSLPVVSSGRDKDTPESRGFGETGAMKSWSNNLFTVNFRLCSEKQLKLSLESLPTTLHSSKEEEWERIRVHS